MGEKQKQTREITMAAEKQQFDLKTHVRDAKGNIIRENPYRLTIINGVHEYERPPGSGYFYTGGNELIRKPKEGVKSAEPIKKEFNEADLLAQIETLKAQLAEAVPLDELEEVHETAETISIDDIPVVPMVDADNSAEISLMKAAGAPLKGMGVLNPKPFFNKPNFLSKDNK